MVKMGKSLCKCYYSFVWFYSSNQLEFAREKLAIAGTSDVDLSNADDVFGRVDLLLEGTDGDKEEALRMLTDARTQVGVFAKCTMDVICRTGITMCWLCLYILSRLALWFTL